MISNVTFADVFMAVFFTSQLALAVIDVREFQPLKSDGIVELLQYI